MAVLFLTLRPSAARHATLHLEVFDLFIHRIRTTCVVLVIALGIAATASAEQTIVFFRHAEKPASGLGNLTCQGLNRALALPAVLLGRFGTPDFVYAPNPSQKVSDSTGSYYYVRPLATIEPTAIRAARSVNTHYGYTDIGSLESLLINARKADTISFVSWEHIYLQRMVQDIMNKYGGGATVPAWSSTDFDTIYVLRVTYVGGTASATFEEQSEGLNGQATSCPQ